jgi:hypothetical protein
MAEWDGDGENIEWLMSIQLDEVENQIETGVQLEDERRKNARCQTTQSLGLSRWAPRVQGCRGCRVDKRLRQSPASDSFFDTIASYITVQ